MIFLCIADVYASRAWRLTRIIDSAVPAYLCASREYRLVVQWGFVMQDIRSQAMRTLKTAFAGASVAMLLCASTCFAQTVRVKSMVYNDSGLKADLFELAGSSGNAKLPAVILLHAGGWSGADRSEFTAFGTWLARQSVVPIAIDYRVPSAATPWPTPLMDAASAVWFVRENAKRLQIDPNRVVILGASAGGHLAAMLATGEIKSRLGTSSRPNLLIALWAPWDLTKPNVGGDGRDLLQLLTGVTDAKDASPLLRITDAMPPTLIIQGKDDSIVPPIQALTACEAIVAARRQCQLVALDEGHGAKKKASVEEVAKQVASFLTRFYPKDR